MQKPGLSSITSIANGAFLSIVVWITFEAVEVRGFVPKISEQSEVRFLRIPFVCEYLLSGIAKSSFGDNRIANCVLLALLADSSGHPENPG